MAQPREVRSFKQPYLVVEQIFERVALTCTKSPPQAYNCDPDGPSCDDSVPMGPPKS
ncbi:MAG: hypothetical protein R6V58_06550 [Planctomycetota bacterium]